VKIKRLLDIKKISGPGSYNFRVTQTDHADLEIKIQELITILETARLNKTQLRNYQDRISKALEKSVFPENPVKPFDDLNSENNMSREELLDGFEILLTQTQIDSNISRDYIRRNTVRKIIIGLISIVLVCLGFAMIIMPAPPSFELFTIFYISHDDGVTVMDLISLLIILSGVFLFVQNFNRK
jgi:hypothetical protein